MTVAKVAVTRVHTGERIADDVQRQGQRAATSLNAMPFSGGVWIRNLALSTTPVVVKHGLGRALTGYFATKAKATPYDDSLAARLWLDRLINGSSLASLASTAGNFSVGCRFTPLVTRECCGVRFAGYNPTTTRTYVCTIWNDSTGSAVATATVTLSANTTTWKAVMFSTPVVLLAGTSYTASVYHTSGTVYIKTPVDTLAGLVPVTWGSDITLTSMALFSAGNARPTSVAGTETYWVEPVLTDRRGVQVETSAATVVDAKTQVSVVASEPATVDLWLY